MDKQTSDKETELNAFARFFGALLLELRSHNLHLKNQYHTQPTHIPKSSLEFIEHIR
jgi:hypothetical protein